jgi:hypothetical protein
MSLLRNLAKRIYGKSFDVRDLEIAFHKKANLHGTHGLLVASHRDFKLENFPVRFVFVGMSEPPAMTPAVIDFIWEEAKSQGYIPHKLLSYGFVLETTSGITTGDLASEERFAGRATDVAPAATQAIAQATAAASKVSYVGSSPTPRPRPTRDGGEQQTQRQLSSQEATASDVLQHGIPQQGFAQELHPAVPNV